MKRKARIQMGIDDRLVAIYARKSRITNKGDSIGVQFKQSADYAINQLSLSEDYEFARYEDKGLSGYYSDRPDFQRLLRDIEMGKIKAVACYKLDRISRKTSDLMRLLEYFERHDVTLLVCSNNINTRISTSKIIIQVLAIIAEFERDILTERIQDNLMELAKDGRWLGGKTPTGFSSQRVTTGSGKNKSAISFLVPVQEEKEIVLEIYSTFWETRSLLQTANIISEKYETKHGAKFTTSTIRLILRNPIYCVADEYSYNYFLEHDGNLFGEPSDFDGQHGLTAYNKTDQMKVEDEDSTFFNPKFSQLLTRNPLVNGLFLWVAMRDLSAPGNGWKHKICWMRLQKSITGPIENQCFVVRLNVLPYLRKTAACTARIQSLDEWQAPLQVCLPWGEGKGMYLQRG